MIVNLFAGPGGLCEGLRSLRVDEVAVGIEYDAAACLTRAAAGHLTIRADVATYPTGPLRGKVSGLIASPPCPDFSSAGKRKGIEGTTGHLIFEVMRWALDLRPRWIACEQVPEVLPWWRLFAQRLRDEAGYKTWTGVLCAADYGVPQERYRAFLLAHAERQPQPPAPTHTEHPHESLFDGDPLPRWVSMAEGLGWGATERTAPTVTGRGGEATNVFGSVGFGAHKALERERERDLVGYRGTRGKGMTERHGERPDSPADRPAPTITGKARTDELMLRIAPTSRQRGGVRGVDEPAPTLAFGHNANDWEWILSRQAGATARRSDQPAPTVLSAGCAKGVMVWTNEGGPYKPYDEDRQAIKLTVEEALILQGFDPDYPVRGSRTKRFEQIGNAVPPPLAAAVLSCLIDEVQGVPNDGNLTS